MIKKLGCDQLRSMAHLARWTVLTAALIALTGIASPVMAATLTVLDTPSETATLKVNDIAAEVAYTIVDGRFELTMKFTEADGASLSTRILLVDGQRFSVAFEEEGDEISATSFAFRRNDQVIEITASAIPTARILATR